jgi:hypothetical protein
MTRQSRRLIAVLTSIVALTSLTLTGAATASDMRTPSNTKTVQSAAYPRPTPLVLDLRYGTHSTYDRVVVDLSGPVTGYRVGYVNRLRYDGSGAPVPLSGKAFLQINVQPANAHVDVDGHVLNVYSGPKLTRPGLPTIKGIAKLGDYEGVVSFGLALDHKGGFRVFTLTNPSRLVIDVAH